MPKFRPIIMGVIAVIIFFPTAYFAPVLVHILWNSRFPGVREVVKEIPSPDLKWVASVYIADYCALDPYYSCVGIHRHGRPFNIKEIYCVYAYRNGGSNIDIEWKDSRTLLIGASLEGQKPDIPGGITVLEKK